MADIAVEARELKRSFNKGKFVAVNGLSLDIKYGQIVVASKSLAWTRLKTQPVSGVS